MFDFFSNLYNKAIGALGFGGSAQSTPSGGVQPGAVAGATQPPAPTYISSATKPSPLGYTNPISPTGNVSAPISPAGTSAFGTGGIGAPSTGTISPAPVSSPGMFGSTGGKTLTPISSQSGSMGIIPKTQPVMRQATTPINQPSAPSPFMDTNANVEGVTKNMPAWSGQPPPARAMGGQQGAGGFMGSTGGSGLTAAQGALGAQGVGSRFSVGAGPLGMFDANSLASLSEEEKRRQQESKFALPPTTPSGRYVGPKPEALLGAPPIPSVIDVGAMEQTIKDSAAFIASPGAKSDSDLTSISNSLKEMIDAGVARALQEKGITPEKTLVEDSPEYQEFLQGKDQQEVFNYQKFADDFRTQNGMSDWLKLKETGKAALTEATKFYNDLIKEVRANPDLPKTLGERRVKLFMDDRDSLIQKARADIKMSQNAIDDINGSLNTQLGIVSAQRSEDDKRKGRELDIFKTLLDNGVQFSSSEKQSWAKKLGLPVGALDSIIAKPDLKYQTNDGVLYQFDSNGLLLKTWGTPGGAGGGGGDFSKTPQSMQRNPLFVGAVNYAPSITSKNQRDAFVAGIQRNSGSEESLRTYLRQYLYNTAGTEEKKRWNTSNLAVDAYQKALTAIDSGKFDAGFWKYAYEGAKAPLALERDPKYSEFRQFVTTAEAAYRNMIYGAALTAPELAYAAGQLFEKGDTNTIARQKIVNNIAINSFITDKMISESLGQPAPSISDYTSGTVPPGDTDDDTIFREEVGSAGGAEADQGGWLSSLWGALTGK